MRLDDGLSPLKKAMSYSHGQTQRIILVLFARDGSTSTSKITMFDVGSAVTSREISQSLLEIRSDDAAGSTQSMSGQDTMVTLTRPPPVDSLGRQCSTCAPNVAHVIGLIDTGRIVFLDRSSWVCTALLSDGGLSSEQGQDSPMIFRHFFVPYD